MVLGFHALGQQISAPHAQPLKFIENKGQWDEQVRYRCDISSSSLFLEPNVLTIDLADPSDLEKGRHAHVVQGQEQGQGQVDLTVHRHAYKIFFDGANTQSKITAENISTEYYNYMHGNDPSKWVSHAYAYEKVRYENIYPKTDLLVYSSGEHIKYDLILAPGADVSEIKMRYQGASGMRVQDNGDLIIHTTVQDVTELKPYAFQKINGKTVAVPCAFTLDGTTVQFIFPEGYNKNFELIIDPELVFGSYTGSPVDNWGYTATYGSDGSLFGGGIVFGSGYPTTVGAYETTFQGGAVDIGISKFSPDGTSLIYSTYIGGNRSELPHSLIATPSDELIIYGTTGSGDFPITAGAYDNTFNGGSNTTVDVLITFPSGIDIYVAKLSADGGTLEASIYIGGSSNDGMNLATGFTTQYNYGDFARGEVIIDDAENIFVASSTTSTNFPVTPGVFQSTLNGDQEGVIFKFNSDLTSLVWSSYIGGPDEDGAYSMKINSLGQPVVCGGTASSNFPTTAGTWHTSYQGGAADGWVAKVSADGTSLLASTFVGTNNYDQTFFVETDDDDNIYFTGQTKGAYPVTPGAYTEAGGKQFITKLNSALTTVDYSVVFGSGASAINISPSAFLVDECENVYVSGWGGTVNQGYNFSTGTTSGMTITPDALQATTDGDDFYFYVLSKDAVDLLFASYFGGPASPEHVDGGTSRFDKNGAIYQAVCAGCWGLDDFPTTPGAWSEVNGGPLCNLGVAKIDFNLAGIYAAAAADPSFIGCAPFDIDFINNSIGAVQYIWDFGDGTPQSTLFEPGHTYTIPGTYSVMLIAIDSLSCNISDTSYVTVTVLSDSITAEFNYSGNESCDSLVATFTTIGSFLPTTEFTWDFGDGTGSTIQDVEHTYLDPGEYIVTLVVEDPSSCNGIDTFTYTITYLYEFNTGFTSEVTGCLPIDATFVSNSTTDDSYNWDFGDGGTATGDSVTHTYTIPGVYTVLLITYRCGIPDTVSQVVVVDDLPIAYFDDDPYYIIVNTNVQFTNLSEHAVSYYWEFGDGGTSTDVNAKHIFTELGTYNVCLTATNSNGCSDTYCREVDAEAEGAIGIPTGFTPNNDGNNDIFIVKGFGIADMHLMVFNRWGELVFETTDPKEGWDGTYRGAEQPMEVYVYSLSGYFADGKTFELHGNVTLLR
ncbi:MAG: PKD domain-containing protein [Chitinophagales bacterium]